MQRIGAPPLHKTGSTLYYPCEFGSPLYVRVKYNLASQTIKTINEAYIETGLNVP